MRLPIAVLGLTLALTSAKDARQPTKWARLHRIFAAAESGTVFRLTTVTGTQLEGILASVDSGAGALGPARPVPLIGVDHLWQRGPAWRTGAAHPRVELHFTPT